MQSSRWFTVPNGATVDEHNQVPKSTSDSPKLKQMNFSKLKGQKFNENPNSDLGGKGW